MISLVLLLALAGSGEDTEGAPNAQELILAVGPCLDVDEDEVRRLVTMELTTSPRVAGERAGRIVVDCEAGRQEVRLLSPDGGELAARTIDLGRLETAGRDARNRELALAIAELVRRGGAEPPPPPPQPAKPPPPTVIATPLAEPSPETDPAWRVQVGALFAVEGWSGGQVQVGPDLGVRVRLTRRWSAELRVGGRRGQTLTISGGELRAVGLATAVGLALDLAPAARRAGAFLAVRAVGDWTQYTATSQAGGASRTGDGGAVAVVAGPAAFVTIASRVRVQGEVTAGGALHTVTVLDDGARVSAISGLGLSGALGLVAQF